MVPFDTEIATINCGLRVAITEDGQELPITNMVDRFGDDCDDPHEAAIVVAGPDRNGYWLTIDLADFDEVPVQ